VSGPGFDQFLAQLPTGFHQKGPGTHRRIADLQVQNLRGMRRAGFTGEPGVFDRLFRSPNPGIEFPFGVTLLVFLRGLIDPRLGRSLAPLL
jgi:hypothetical protein